MAWSSGGRIDLTCYIIYVSGWWWNLEETTVRKTHAGWGRNSKGWVKDAADEHPFLLPGSITAQWDHSYALSWDETVNQQITFLLASRNPQITFTCTWSTCVSAHLFKRAANSPAMTHKHAHPDKQERLWYTVWFHCKKDNKIIFITCSQLDRHHNILAWLLWSFPHHN